MCRKFLALLFILTLLLSACGATPEPTAAPTEPAAVQPTDVKAEPTPTEERTKYGGTLRWAVEDDVIFNPVHSTPRPSAHAMKLAFDSLTRMNEQLEPVGQMAKNWEVSDDGLTWTFYLHENMKWHDGEPCTAEDVKFTLDELLKEENAWRYRSNLAAIDNVEVVDPYTVRIHTAYPYAPLLNMLSYFVYIAPKHILEGNFLDNDDFNLKNPIGNGPFKVVEVGEGYIRYEAFEDYYLGRPYLDEIVVSIIQDPETQVAQLIAGELDLHEIAPGRHSAVLENQDHLKVISSPTTKYNHSMVNHDDPVLGDRLVILALIHALDRQAMIDSVMMGRADMPVATIPKSIGWAFADDLEPIPYDPEKAKELLQEAGFVMGEKYWEKDGKPLSFTISADNVASDRRENAVIAQQYWRDIGIDAKLEIMDWTTWLYERFRGVPEVTNGYWSHPTDPDQAAYWSCEGSMNVPYSRYCNEEVDRLFAEGARTLDREERREIYHQIQETMLEDPPLIIFYYLTETNAMAKNLMGIPNLEMRDALQFAEQWYFEK